MVNRAINILEAVDNFANETIERKEFSSSVSELYLEKIKQILNEAIQGLRDLDAYKDKMFIRLICDECQNTLGEIPKLDLNQPDDQLKLLAIGGKLNAVRRVLLLEIGSLEKLANRPIMPRS